MLKTQKTMISILLILLTILILPFRQSNPVEASNSFSFIILSNYKKTLDIGDEFYLYAFTSNGKAPTFKSSDSKIASVNSDGKITPKKAGTVLITVKTKDAQSHCKVTVRKTNITINQSSLSLECGAITKLSAISSNQSKIKWKSSKSSIASVNEAGLVKAKKPGETTITAYVNGSEKTCRVIVKSPTISLNQSKVTLYRNQTTLLHAQISSGKTPKFKTNKSSVATVDSNGTITAIKHGTAIITVTIDGVSETCEVIVEQPTITLNTSETTIKVGDVVKLKANVSSNNTPIWSTSNQNIAVVDSDGNITGLAKGRAYIYAKEDGVSARCTVYVTK